MDIEPRSEIITSKWDNILYYGHCQQYTSIPTDIPKDAHTVEIFGNPITGVFDGDFNDFSELRYLYLNFNSIAQIEVGSLSDLNRLYGLQVRYNDLTVISENLFNGLTLDSLDLSNNKIHTLHPRAFQEADIEYVHIKNNELTVIETGTFAHLKSLKTVSLQFNKLRSLEPDIFPSKDSILLFLHSNNLTTLPSNVFSGSLPTELQLTLTNNPLVCDFSTCWLKEGESDGSISWLWDYLPKCSNNDIEWKDWNCTTGKTCLRLAA